MPPWVMSEIRGRASRKKLRVEFALRRQTWMPTALPPQADGNLRLKDYGEIVFNQGFLEDHVEGLLKQPATLMAHLYEVILKIAGTDRLVSEGELQEFTLIEAKIDPSKTPWPNGSKLYSLYVPRLGDALSRVSHMDGFAGVMIGLREACWSTSNALSAAARQLTEAILWGMKRRMVAMDKAIEALRGQVDRPAYLGQGTPGRKYGYTRPRRFPGKDADGAVYEWGQETEQGGSYKGICGSPHGVADEPDTAMPT